MSERITSFRSKPPEGGTPNDSLVNLVSGAFLLHALKPMDTATESLGLIAGNRSLPLEFARQAREMGVKRLVAVA